MTTATKTTSKSKSGSKAAKTAAKAVNKVPAASVPAAPIVTFATILAAALEGKFGGAVKGYFQTAAAHARRMGTVFPRAPYAEQRKAWESLPADQREKKISETLSRIAAGYGRQVAGSNDGRALYDLMRMGK